MYCMALPDSHYVVAFPPQICFRDKDTGLPLSAGLVYFYKDTDRTVLKDVYQQVQLPDNTYEFVALPNPVTLTSIGTFGDDSGNDILVYTFPYEGTPSNPGEEIELYFLEVYSSDNILQFTREAYPPNAVGVDGGAVDAASNEVLNSQFVQVLFDVPAGQSVYSVAVSGADNEIEIAPNWSLVTSGSGTVTLRQVGISNVDVETNPPYALQVSTAGSITEVYLRQRLTASPRLLYGANLQGSVMAAGIFPTQVVTVSMTYEPSGGSSYMFFNDPTLATGAFTALSGAVAIDETANPDIAPDGYVDVKVSFTPLSTIQITSIQVIQVETTSSTSPYIQESTPQQINGLFNYYLPQLSYKPIPSLLTGWDFPLNPAQFGLSGNVGSDPAYIWDQTIAKRGATAIAYTRQSITGGLQFTTAGTVPDSFMIMQYLTVPQAQEILGTRLSVNMFAYRGSAGGAVTCRIYLFRGSSSAVFPDLSSNLMIGSLAADGTFTKNSTAGQGENWTEISRSQLGVPTFTLSTVTNNSDINNGTNDYGFSGWEITDNTQISDTDKFCMIVTFSYAAINTVVTVNSISLIPGDIPTRPAPQTANAVLQDCQYYYEKSYSTDITPGTASANGYVMTVQRAFGTVNINLRALSFLLPLKTQKVGVITSGLVSFYNPVSGTVDEVYGSLRIAGGATLSGNIAASSWTFSGATATGGLNYITYLANTDANLLGTQVGATEAIIEYHYTVDSRLGIV